MNKPYYTQISYQPPANSPASYATKAQTILDDLEFNTPDYLSDFIDKDILLLFAGLSTITGNLEKLSDIKHGRQSTQLKKILSSHNIESVNFNGEHLLVNTKALVDLQSTYQAVEFPELVSPLTADSFREWISTLHQTLQATIEPIDSSQTLNIQRIWIGILRGYPGEAVMSMQADSTKLDSGLGYTYGAHLKDNLNILSHVEMWQKTLTQLNI